MSGAQGPDSHGPGVRVPPPVMVGGIALLGWALSLAVPVRLGPPLVPLGNTLIFAALMLIGWAVIVMARAGVDPRPDRPDAALLEGGPFRHSRNPIYLGFLMVAAGFALRVGDLWCWLAVAACFAVLEKLVIAKEEAYLEARFGAAYAAYRGRVRRWV